MNDHDIENKIRAELDRHLSEYKSDMAFLASGSWGIETREENSDYDCVILLRKSLKGKETEIFEKLKQCAFPQEIFTDIHFSPRDSESIFFEDAWPDTRMLTNRINYCIFSIINLKSRTLWGADDLTRKAKVDLLERKDVYTPRDHLISTISRAVQKGHRKGEVQKAYVDYLFIKDMLFGGHHPDTVTDSFIREHYLKFKSMGQKEGPRNLWQLLKLLWSDL